MAPKGVRVLMKRLIFGVHAVQVVHQALVHVLEVVARVLSLLSSLSIGTAGCFLAEGGLAHFREV